jgi:hypothetical protein
MDRDWPLPNSMIFQTLATISVFSTLKVFGTSVAHAVFHPERKEVNQMKNAKAFLAALILLGTTTGIGTALAAGVISKQPLTPDSYCHEEFPAITANSLATDEPALKSPNSGDVIDFYGPCSESPTGKDQVSEQRLEFEHRMDNDYD